MFNLIIETPLFLIIAIILAIGFILIGIDVLRNFKENSFKGVMFILVTLLAVGGGYQLSTAPPTVASGNPLAGVLNMLPASADTSVLSTDVNGVDYKSVWQKGGTAKSLGVQGSL